MKPRDLLPALALAAVLAAVAVAEPSPPAKLSIEIRGPLDGFNLSKCFYRDMNISLTLSMNNVLRPAPPPRCPSLEPVDGSMTCGCSLLPGKWWPNATWLLVLSPGEAWSTIVSTTVPGDATLGGAKAGFSCGCWWREWCRYTTTTTAVYCRWCCCRWENNTCVAWGSCCCSTETYTVTVTSTTVEHAAVEAVEDVTVLSRRVNETLLPVELGVTGYRALGNGSALVDLTAKLYNLGLGLHLGNETPVPLEKGMLLIHGLTVYVDGRAAIRCRGYCAPAHHIPAEPNATPAPSVAGSVNLTLNPPGKPTNSYTFNVTICYTEDKPEPTRTCVPVNVTVPLPFGWRKIIYVADDCSVLNEAWKIVPANETGVQVELAEDRVKPSLTARNHCIVAEAGACEPVKLDVYSNGILTASRTGRGSITWCPVEPGTYMATAVDYFNNTVTGTFNLTWTAGPPPALRSALLRLSAVLIAFMVVLYIVLEGRWPLRGP